MLTPSQLSCNWTVSGYACCALIPGNSEALSCSPARRAAVTPERETRPVGCPGGSLRSAQGIGGRERRSGAVKLGGFEPLHALVVATPQMVQRPSQNFLRNFRIQASH